MDNLITLAVFLPVGLFAVYKAKVVFNQRDNRRLVNLWLFSFYLAIGLFFRLEQIYLAFDGRLGYRNLAWLLSVVFLTVALYTLAADICDIFCERKPGWLKPMLVIVLATYGGVYLFGIATGPEYYYPGDLRAVDLPSLLIRSVMLSYALAAVSSMASVFGRMYRQEHSPATRLRWGAFWLSSVSARVLFLVRLLSAVGGYFNLWPAPVWETLNAVALITQSLFLLWLFGYLPERYNPAGWPAYIRDLICLRDMRTLYTCLEKVYASPAKPEAGWWSQLKEPDRYLHQMLIAVLDARLYLAQHPAAAAALDCRQLPERLKTIDDNGGDAEQMQAYCALGKFLRVQRFRKFTSLSAFAVSDGSYG